MKKGIGPQGLGASKSPAKMYNSPAKQTSEKEMAYRSAQVKADSEKQAEKNNIKDGQTASNQLKKDMMPRTDANFNKAKAKATKDRIAKYGFPKSVSDK